MNENADRGSAQREDIAAQRDDLVEGTGLGSHDASCRVGTEAVAERSVDATDGELRDEIRPDAGAHVRFAERRGEAERADAVGVEEP